LLLRQGARCARQDQCRRRPEPCGRRIRSPTRRSIMPLYRLVPIAAPDDPNWDRALNQGEVVVRARSSGEARAIAALAEAEAAAGEPALATTQVRASAFMDDKLYAVRDEPNGQWPEEGEPGVVDAAFAFPPDYVAMDD